MATGLAELSIGRVESWADDEDELPLAQEDTSQTTGSEPSPHGPQDNELGIIIGNLPHYFAPEDVADFFGNLRIADIQPAKTGPPTAFYVEMASERDVSDALRADNVMVKGKPVHVRPAWQQSGPPRDRYDQRGHPPGPPAYDGGRGGYDDHGARGYDTRGPPRGFDRDVHGPPPYREYPHDMGYGGPGGYGVHGARPGPGPAPYDQRRGSRDFPPPREQDWHARPPPDEFSDRHGSRRPPPGGPYPGVGPSSPSAGYPRQPPPDLHRPTDADRWTHQPLPPLPPLPPPADDGSRPRPVSLPPPLHSAGSGGVMSPTVGITPKPKSNPFGSAKPVDTAAKLKELEEKARKRAEEEEAARKAAEEKRRQEEEEEVARRQAEELALQQAAAAAPPPPPPPPPPQQQQPQQQQQQLPPKPRASGDGKGSHQRGSSDGRPPQARTSGDGRQSGDGRGGGRHGKDRQDRSRSNSVTNLSVLEEPATAAALAAATAAVTPKAPEAAPAPSELPPAAPASEVAGEEVDEGEEEWEDARDHHEKDEEGPLEGEHGQKQEQQPTDVAAAAEAVSTGGGRHEFGGRRGRGGAPRGGRGEGRRGRGRGRGQGLPQVWRVKPSDAPAEGGDGGHEPGEWETAGGERGRGRGRGPRGGRGEGRGRFGGRSSRRDGEAVDVAGAEGGTGEHGHHHHHHHHHTHADKDGAAGSTAGSGDAAGHPKHHHHHHHKEKEGGRGSHADREKHREERGEGGSRRRTDTESTAAPAAASSEAKEQGAGGSSKEHGHQQHHRKEAKAPSTAGAGDGSKEGSLPKAQQLYKKLQSQTKEVKKLTTEKNVFALLGEAGDD